MSRFYSMELIVEKDSPSQEEFVKLQKVYESEWGIDSGYKDKGKAMFGEEGTLCGGESEEEAHDRIRDAVKEAVPGCSVMTRWTYLEDLPYAEYTD